MGKCECGCGKETMREFLPGHDQKLRVALEQRVGGLLSLRALVDDSESFSRGTMSDTVFLQRIRTLLLGVIQ